MKLETKLTIKEATAKLAELGVTIRKKDTGEYRVNRRGGIEATAYYTDDLVDAFLTGRLMSQKVAPIVMSESEYLQ